MLLSSRDDESGTRCDDDKGSGNPKLAGLCFLDDSLDWAGLRWSGECPANERVSNNPIKLFMYIYYTEDHHLTRRPSSQLDHQVLFSPHTEAQHYKYFTVQSPAHWRCSGSRILFIPPSQGGSSLDLSPSDSCGSGGTYMWDEEGLGPLGSAATTTSTNTNGSTTLHIGSFDSDLSSIVRSG